MPALSAYANLNKAELLALLESQEQGVRISFMGKESARQIARSVRPRVMESIAKYSSGRPEQQAENMIIEGENLQAMVSLYRYRGQIDLILTDPPYNTGKDFRYNDRWNDDPNDPDLGALVSADDGARHTKWMRFMWPRLQTMKAMLKPSGVLAICIDHRELFRLGTMLDEIFGEHNRLGIINWEKSYTRRNDKAHVSSATEYVLVYANDADIAKTHALPRTAMMDARYSSPDGDARIWQGLRATAPSGKSHQGMVYAVQSPFTGLLHYPQENRCWVTEKRKLKKSLEQWGSKYTERELNDGCEKALVIAGASVPDEQKFIDDRSLQRAKIAATEILERGNWPAFFWSNGGEGVLSKKTYLEDVKKGFVPSTFWADDEYDEQPISLDAVSWQHEDSGHSNAGISELTAIVGPHGFETVKPLKLFRKIIQIWCPPTGIVLDPFSGSGTTGDAALRLNAEFSATRRFILIEQGRPERGDSYARSLTANRLKRLVEGNWINGKRDGVSGGFSFLSLRSRVDAEAVLAMERSLMADTVVASHFDATRRSTRSLVRISEKQCPYLVARNDDNEGFFLIWEGEDKSPVLDANTYDAIVCEALAMNFAPIYHVYARFNLYQSDDVKFYQIPNRILMDFGLSESADAFNNVEDSVSPLSAKEVVA